MAKKKMQSRKVLTKLLLQIIKSARFFLSSCVFVFVMLSVIYLQNALHFVIVDVSL